MMRARGFLVAAILSMAAAPAVADDIVGRVRVIDGDTIEINGTRIQLWGIDAPEIDQLCRGENSQLYECGEKSATALAGILHAIGRPAICTPKGEDQHHHILAVCKIGDPGPDIAHWMVANGHALDWPKHSGGYYAEAQQKAQAAGRGFWAGSFVAPWIFRDCIRDETPSYCSDEAK